MKTICAKKLERITSTIHIRHGAVGEIVTNVIYLKWIKLSYNEAEGYA